MENANESVRFGQADGQPETGVEPTMEAQPSFEQRMRSLEDEYPGQMNFRPDTMLLSEMAHMEEALRRFKSKEGGAGESPDAGKVLHGRLEDMQKVWDSDRRADAVEFDSRVVEMEAGIANRQKALGNLAESGYDEWTERILENREQEAAADVKEAFENKRAIEGQPIDVNDPEALGSRQKALAAADEKLTDARRRLKRISDQRTYLDLMKQNGGGREHQSE